MSGLVVEHRESQFSRRLRRRRVQIAVGIAAVEAVLVVAGVLPWWLVVAAAAGSVALYVWLGRDHTLAGRSRSDMARRRLAAHRRPRSRRARGRRRPRDRRRRRPRSGGAGRAPARPALICPDRPGRRVHSASRFTGAWPSGKATGFGPVIPGSNPGAPANVPTVSESRPKLAAVVMAGGRGTRMRSATPKHLHPILGRRMVDWIVEAARPLEPDSLVVVVSPETADQFAGLTTAVQEQALGTGDAVRCAEEAAGRRRRGAHPLRRHAAPDDRAARGAARDASLAGRRRDRALVRPRRHPELRADRPQRRR